MQCDEETSNHKLSYDRIYVKSGARLKLVFTVRISSSKLELKGTQAYTCHLRTDRKTDGAEGQTEVITRIFNFSLFVFTDALRRSGEVDKICSRCIGKRK